MKKITYNLILSLSLIFMISCEDLVEGINDNPNDIIVTDVEERLFYTERFTFICSIERQPESISIRRNALINVVNTHHEVIKPC